MPPAFDFQQCKNQDIDLECSDANFEPNPEIAGVGVINSFFATSLAAATLTLVYIGWQVYVQRKLHKIVADSDSRKKRFVSKAGCFNAVFEAVIVSCSDAQIFTGLAFGSCIFLHQCVISAYHYNIILNLLIIVCATHMVTFAVVRHYFVNPYLACLRMAFATVILGLTLTLLIRQSLCDRFPVGTLNPQNVELMWPAACFSKSRLHGCRQPGNQSGIAGQWGLVTAVGVGYVLAIGSWRGRKFNAGPKRQLLYEEESKDGNMSMELLEMQYYAESTSERIWAYTSLVLTVIAGIVVAVICWLKISKSRDLINTNLGYDNPEDDASSFGQFIPMTLCALTLFALCDTGAGR